MEKQIVLIVVLLLACFVRPLEVNSQEDDLMNGCKTYFKSPFVVTNRSFKAFLTGEEVAEFRTTFFSGTIYRLVSCGFESENIEFKVMDIKRKVLFASAEYPHIDSWDFQMEGSMECIIEARLKVDKVQSGMIFMLLGFKSSNPQAAK